jgi:hypothetical protein
MPKGKDTSKDMRRRVDRASWQPMGRIDNMTSEKHVAAAKAAGETFGLEDYEYTTQGNESPSSTGTVMGRAVEVEPGKYSFEWQNINDTTGEPSQNFAGRQMGQWVDQDANWGASDGYEMQRADSLMESFGDDYNAYKAHMAGEVGSDEERPEPYPEGWSQSFPGGELTNEDANTFRLPSKHYTMKGAMRSGRKAIAKGRTFYSQGPDLGGYKGGY